jgi:hypothetical protein
MTVDLNAEVHRAGEARQILDAPVFVAARKNLEEQLATLRKSAPLMATELHTRLILMEQLAEQFFDYFEQIAQTGKMAEMQLTQEEERRGLLERGLDLFRTQGRN